LNYIDDMQLTICPAEQDNEINYRTDFYENNFEQFSGKSLIRVKDQYGSFLDYSLASDNY